MLKKIREILADISACTYGNQMDDKRMSLQKHIGTDRNKLIQAEADIKAGTADRDVSFQIFVIALVTSINSLVAALIPNESYCCILKGIFAFWKYMLNHVEKFIMIWYNIQRF